MEDSSLAATEDRLLSLPTSTTPLSKQEIAERRNELRRMRELVMRAELKKARAGKIKSKVYRKLQRAKKNKLNGEEEGDVNDADQALEKETLRARERAGLKMKTRDRQKLNREREDGDEDGEGGSRRELEEELERGERLERVIRGNRDAGSESENDEYGDDENAREKAFVELGKLRGDASAMTAGEGKMGKGVFEMKFMRDAMARREREAEGVVEEYIQELRDVDSGNEDADEERDAESGVVVQRVGGRIVLRPGMVGVHFD